MNRKYGKAGKSVREMAEQRRKSSILILIIGLGITVIAFLISMNKNAMASIGGKGAVVILLIALFVPDIVKNLSKKKDREESRAIRGAVAEEKIGALLDELGEEYEIIHDISSQFGNIDHLIIGKRCGIILLETKSHRGTVTVNDEKILINGKPAEKDFFRQTLSNTYWLKQQVESTIQVKSWITPVIVFTNGFVRATAPVKGVYILNKKYLLQFIENQSRSSNQVIWESREKIRELLLFGSE